MVSNAKKEKVANKAHAVRQVVKFNTTKQCGRLVL